MSEPSPAAAMAFPQFGKLPKEVRLEIWRECLPNRVVELDEPVGHVIAYDPAQADYCCLFNHTARINRRPPVISRVCHESRMVALEHVDLLPDGVRVDAPTFGTSMGIEDWVDKRRDVLHLNYDEAYDVEYPLGECDPVRFLLSEAATRARDASLTEDYFLSLTRKREHLDTFRNQSLLVCLRIVTIHAPLPPALDSGLFGLLGDARVVLVDAADTERKKRYRAFWEAHGIGAAADPHPARFFDKFCPQDTWVREKLEELQITWLLFQWIRTKDQVAGVDTAWVKKPTGSEDWEEQPWTWQHWVPDREHWWTRDMLKSMPRLRPTVMFRLCTQNCPEKDEGGYPIVSRAP